MQLRDHRCDRQANGCEAKPCCIRWADALTLRERAIERNVDPGEWTDRNIEQMRANWTGFLTDWSREQATRQRLLPLDPVAVP